MSKTGFKKGRLGIGTDNPRYPLDVVGDIRLTGGFRDASGNDFNFLAINNQDILKRSDINGITSSNSKIGILNTDPSEELDVSGNINFTGTLKQNGVEFGGGKFQDGATSGEIYYNGGNVGIGTTDPKVKLNVEGGGFLVDGTDTVTQQGCHIQWNRSGNHGETHIINNIGGAYNNGEHSGIHFAMTDSGGTVSDKMFIRNNGNVGIGTTSPRCVFNVNSFMTNTDTTIPTGVGTFNASTTLFLGKSSDSNTGVHHNYWGLIMGTLWSGRSYIYSGHTDNSTYYDLLLNPLGGNVGIGNQIPSYKLDVDGDINFTGTLRKNGDPFGGGGGGYGDVMLGEIINSNYWGIVHNNFIATSGNNYAFHLTNDGYTALNCSTGKDITFRENNSVIMTIVSSKVEVNGFIKIKQPGQIQHDSSNAYKGIVFENTGSSHAWYTGYRHGGHFTIGYNNTSTYNEFFHINATTGYFTLKPYTSTGINHTWDDSLNNNNKLFFGDANFGMGAGKFAYDMGSSTNSECTAIWCYQGPGRGIRFCSTGDGDDHKLSEMTTRMIVHGDTGNVGIGTTEPGGKLHVKSSTSPQLLLDDDSHFTGGGGEIYFGNSGHGVGRNTGLTDFTSGNDVVLHTAGDGGAGIKTAGGFLKMSQHGTVEVRSDSKYIGNFITNTAGNCGIMISPVTGSDGDGYIEIRGANSGTNHGKHVFIGCTRNGSDHYNSNIVFKTRSGSGGYMYNTATEIMRIKHNGRVGIGTTEPGYPLHVAGSVGGPSGIYLRDTWALSRIDLNLIAILWSTSFGTRNVGLKVDEAVWPESVLISSDERIKENIVDVSDNLALEMLRNIPVKYYEYKDKLNKGTGKTIGFIAQEVKEHLPMAVGIQTNIIPNEMRFLTDISWNDTTLYTDLSDCSGIKYRFYVSNDISGNYLVKKEVIGNSDNSFTFDQSWNHVFCYGREVDDFHTLDKQKLFALNFSATQELDRQQQADKLRIAELEQEVNELKTIVHALKNHLGLSSVI